MKTLFVSCLLLTALYLGNGRLILIRCPIYAQSCACRLYDDNKGLDSGWLVCYPDASKLTKQPYIWPK